jgi:uncharacterized membrane protein
VIPVIVAVWIVSSLLIAMAGRRYRFGFWGYLFGSLLLSPVIGFLLLAAAIPVRVRRQPSSSSSSTTAVQERGTTR